MLCEAGNVLTAARSSNFLERPGDFFFLHLSIHTITKAVFFTINYLYNLAADHIST